MKIGTDIVFPGLRSVNFLFESVDIRIDSCLQICNLYACRPKLNNCYKFCIKLTHYVYVSDCTCYTARHLYVVECLLKKRVCKTVFVKCICVCGGRGACMFACVCAFEMYVLAWISCTFDLAGGHIFVVQFASAASAKSTSSVHTPTVLAVDIWRRYPTDVF